MGNRDGKDPTPQEEWTEHLVRLQLEARRELESLGWGPDWKPTGEQETDHKIHRASWLVVSINKFFQAIEEGDVWNAIRYAKDIGMYQGRKEGPGFTGYAATKGYARWLEPDAKRGRTVIEAAAKGGRVTKGWRKVDDISDDQLRSEIARLCEEGETLTNARRRVSRDYGIPLSTLRRRTE